MRFGKLRHKMARYAYMWKQFVKYGAYSWATIDYPIPTDDEAADAHERDMYARWEKNMEDERQ